MNDDWRGWGALVGGGLVAWGAFLPWITFGDGSGPYRGVGGSNGLLILAGSVILLVTGIVLLEGRGRRPWIVEGPGAVAFLILVFSLHLLARLWAGVGDLRVVEPALEPGIGPGLPLCVLGGFVAVATLLLPGGEEREAESDEDPAGGARAGSRLRGIRIGGGRRRTRSSPPLPSTAEGDLSRPTRSR